MNREYLETLLKDFGEILTTETVIGDPITVGKVTILPVVSVSFAFGSGGGTKSSEGEKPLASAASAGARLTPVAFLTIHEDGTVGLHHVKTKESNTLADRLLEMAPGILDKVSAGINKAFGKNAKDSGSSSSDSSEADIAAINELLDGALLTTDDTAASTSSEATPEESESKDDPPTKEEGGV